MADVRAANSSGKEWKRESNDTEPDSGAKETYKFPPIEYPVGLVLNPNFGGKSETGYKFDSLTRQPYSSKFGNYYANIPGGYKLLLKSDNDHIGHKDRTLIRVAEFSKSDKEVRALDITGNELEQADVTATEGFIDTAIEAVTRVTQALKGLERTLDTTPATFDTDMVTYQNTKNEAELYLACVDGLDKVPQLEKVIRKLKDPLNAYKEADAKVYNIIFEKPFQQIS